MLLLCCLNQIQAQEDYEKRIRDLKKQRELVVTQEKEALKEEINQIEARLQAGEITQAEAQEQKEAAAERRALNIENRQAIIDNEIALLERNKGEVIAIQDSTAREKEKERTVVIEYPDFDEDCEFFGWGCDYWDWDKHWKYDRRTYSDLVIAFGFSNADVEGTSLEDSPYKLAGSRFFEIGWNWRTRVFRNSNWLRFHYGFMFQFDGLKPKDNQYFVLEDGTAVLQEFEYNLDKSKFRMDKLVVPIHFEMGPSRTRISDNRIRYSLKNQFRFGVGGYGGFKIGSRQKLKYTADGDRRKDKLKGGLNSSDLIYGLSTYMGVDGFLIYFRYDLNPIVQDATVEQNLMALGFRIEI